MRKAQNDEMFAALWSVCPLLKQIRVRPQTEGDKASYQREDGKVLDMDYNLLPWGEGESFAALLNVVSPH
jgi:hypothetical protein